jgi:carboxyl-terminal processing protease
MPADSPKRFNIWTPLTFSVILILGILIGFQLNKYLAKKRPISNVVERNDRLEEIIDIISTKYVDSVSTDSLYEDAVNGILKHLDPHTVYIPAKDLAQVTEDLEGNFKGIGVEFYILKDTLMITSVLKNGPSADAGIQPGDKVLKVNDSSIIGYSSEGIISKLRGIEGSSVKLGLLRSSENRTLDIEVKRGVIPIFSIDAAYMIDAETGYIRINRFSATTYREFMKALNTLLAAGMKQMILDLRQNPGGYLDAATAIADELIGGDKLLVYTQGRNSQKEEYMSGQKGKFENGRLVVLVDEGSASASEILAGAVQDWDRGVVIGRRSYGKGLVQEQFELGDGSALRLTIARYFTPSGRSIQRPYNKGREEYEEAFENRYRDGTLFY